MLLIALWTLFVVQVLTETPPAPPKKIHVDNWRLTWTPAPEETDVTYTVQYSRFDEEKWVDVRACVRIAYNSCNVSFTKDEGEHGCVKLHVIAERRGLQSIPVEACNRQNDRCTPNVELSARPGSLTVHLSKNHSLAYEYGGQARHRIYYFKEGEQPQEFIYNDASVSIDELEVGQRYCVKVQYAYYNILVGLPSCTKCVLIPEPEKEEKPTQIIVGVVIVLFLVIVIPAIFYIILFKQKRIKKYLQPPVQIPIHFSESPSRYPMIAANEEERCDIISSITRTST